MNPFLSEEQKEDVDNKSSGRKSIKDYVGGYGGKEWLNFKK